ncbi:hypothetical protein SUVC_10G0570 [Saccharomyces uvarum]|uniref:Uncharacterized protein n=1 Tax=Saccharomyces uvarum TaxID=230603 RepID=A0AA35J137_SACUV|nr:hypothetical protein SUVC_10G0570 [Saccharomyces uvarum]
MLGHKRLYTVIDATTERLVDTKLLTTLENATAWINSNSLDEDEDDMPHVTGGSDWLDGLSLRSARLSSHLAGSDADPLHSVGMFHTPAVLTALPTSSHRKKYR